MAKTLHTDGNLSSTFTRAPEKNIWLSVSLSDYEAHMGLPGIAQAQALADLFEIFLRVRKPASVALLGCAGGNGLDRVNPAITRRVVALDVNPGFVEMASRRHSNRFETFEDVVQDISDGAPPPFRPVEAVFAGLILEYVPLAPALRFIRSSLDPGGSLACVLQSPSGDLPEVSPSPYTSLEILSPHIRLIEPAAVREMSASAGFGMDSEGSLLLPNGKEFVWQTYRLI